MFCPLFCDMLPDLERPGVRGDLRLFYCLSTFSQYTSFCHTRSTVYVLSGMFNCSLKDRWFSPFSLLFCPELRCLVFEYHIYGQSLPNASSELLLSKCVGSYNMYFCQLSAKGPLTYHAFTYNAIQYHAISCYTVQRHIIILCYWVHHVWGIVFKCGQQPLKCGQSVLN